MTHEEQRLWLIKYLIDEEPRYRNQVIPNDEQEQKNLLRALMNIRMPKPLTEVFTIAWITFSEAELDWG